MKKRGQHHVWRHYLKAWSVDDKVFCLRLSEGRVFQANVRKVGKERDFYRLRELNQEDIEFIKKLVIEPSPVHLQRLHSNLVKQFNCMFELKRLLQSKGIDDAALNYEIEEAMNNLEEDLHCRIEDSVVEHIDSILRGDISFSDTDKGYMDFMYFLCVQYMRTKKIKANILANVRTPQNIDMERIWPVLSHIFATNMGWSWFAERNNFPIVLLDNQISEQFITGDQPVINTYATGDLKNPPTQVEHYYPVSPTIAVLVAEKGKYGSKKTLSLSAEEVSGYNQQIVRNAYDQVYASSKKTLEAYIDGRDRVFTP